MCRGFQQNERERLKIKAFYIQLSVACTKNKATLPEFLTLHYLPRLNGSVLEINGSGVRPDSPAFVTLHRVLSKQGGKGVVYGCRERVVVCEGLRFEVYVGDVKVLKGIFRKDEGENWKMECKCEDVVEGVKFAEVCAAAEEGTEEVVMSERVEMVAAPRRRRGKRCGELEEIPEEREEGSDVSCCCCECRGEAAMDSGDCEMEVEMEGVRWAVDVGIWVVCLGVGYLVSKASSKRLRRRRLI